MRLRTYTATAALMVLLTACGGGESSDEPAVERTAPNGDVFNDADVEFAQQMIPHHAQALEMVDLMVGRELAPEVAALAEDIRAAQTPEVEAMSDWLTAWGEPVPETSIDHANAHGDGEVEGMDEMPGMMSSAEMDALEAASDADFEDVWLQMMIEHHAGAVEMAEAQQADGAYRPAIELAEQIEVGQAEEIETMEGLLP